MMIIIGISLLIIIHLFVGYKLAEKNKDIVIYNFSLVLKDTAWNNSDKIIYFIDIIMGFLTIFGIKKMFINKVYKHKASYFKSANNYKVLAKLTENDIYLKKGQDILDNIKRYENEVEIPFYKKYKIDICDYCFHQKNCNKKNDNYTCEKFTSL